jgi:glutamyl-tRNA synthetase
LSSAPLPLEQSEQAVTEGEGCWNAMELEKSFKKSCESINVNPGSVMQAFRVCLSGIGGGPVLWEMAELLGKEEVVKRLETALERIKE